MTIKLNGSTDGSVSFTAPADTSPTGSDITLTLPTTAGSANQFVKNSGTAGTLEYSSMVETSTGVGIGTTTPTTTFEVETSGVDDRIRFNGPVQIQRPSDWWSSGSIYTVNNIGQMASEGSFRLTLTANGYRDTNNEWVSLGVNNSTGASQIGLDPTGQIVFSTDATKNTGATATVTERGRFLTNGQFRINNLAGSTNVDVRANTAGVLFRSSSDGTLKENVTTLGSQLENVKALNPVSYNWIDTDFYGTQREIGFIAQEVQPLIPEVITTNSDNKLGISYSLLTATLTKALQEAIAKIETLETKVAALEAAE